MKIKILFFVCFILFIVSFACVSATEDINQSDSTDTFSVSLNDEMVFSSADNGTFSDLQKKIDGADEKSTIYLENDYAYSGNGNGISISKELTIDGNGHTIDGNHASRIFNITSDVVLNNITFINAKVGEYDYGGAIIIENSNVTIKNCVFQDNNAFFGGAIYAHNSILFISNSVFFNNTACSGAALYFHDGDDDNVVVISNSVFNGNLADENLEIDGDRESEYVDGHVILSSNDNLLDNQGYFPIYYEDAYSPISLTLINVSYNEYKNQSFKVKSENDYGGYLANKSIRFEVYNDDLLLINTTNITDEKGIARIGYGNLSAGYYNLKVYYKNLSDSRTIRIYNDVDFTMSVDDIYIGEDLIVDFNISSDIDSRDTYYGDAAGDVTVLRYDEDLDEYVWAYDNYFYFKDNNITISSLHSGSYIIFLKFNGDQHYCPKEINQTFVVYPAEYNMTGNKTVLKADFKKTSEGNKRLYVNLTDINTNPLKNKEILIEINGVTYKRTTDDNGSASIAINLNVEGDYSIIISFKGDLEYLPTTEIVSFSNPLSIYCDIYMVKYCKGSQPFTASFLDHDGNFLSDGIATFNINGVFYKRNIDPSGFAKLNINLDQGNYTITATNPVTGAMRSCLIEVLPTITDNNDLVKYYRNDSQFEVRLQGVDDISNQKVTFNINGVFYERYAKDNGIVKLNINLAPGEYIITSEFNGCRVSNRITVLPVLKADNLTMNYLDGSKFNVTLVNGEGNPLADTDITFNINGVFYTRTTDENGVAHLNINLMKGEYIITSSYNGSNVANKITIV